MPVSATAAFAAMSFFQIVSGRDTTEFERLRDVLVDGFLHLVHFALRVQEVTNQRIRQGGFAFFFEVTDFGFAQLDTLMLLVMEKVTFFIQGIELGARFFVADKFGNAIADALVFRLLQNGFAEFLCLLSENAPISRR